MSDCDKIYCYGELLWDCFPGREILGGAPFNVAYRLQQAGARVTLLSALGSDRRGQDALTQLKDLGLDTDSIKVHADLPTGFVKVHLDAAGAATYTIAQPVAWDKIPIPSTTDLEGSMLIFGSLALRQEYNRRELKGIFEACKLRVFDINLRPPHYNMDYLCGLISSCDCLKLNEEELPLVLSALQIEEIGLRGQLAVLSKNTNTPTICVTLGSDGAALWHASEFYTHPGFPAIVADTVGAGDAFLAGFVKTLFVDKASPVEALAFGCALGALVAAKKGATAPVASAEIRSLIAG